MTFVSTTTRFITRGLDFSFDVSARHFVETNQGGSTIRSLQESSSFGSYDAAPKFFKFNFLAVQPVLVPRILVDSNRYRGPKFSAFR